MIEAKGLKRFTLIGHSLGGRVSMLYAARHHQLLERLVLVDITPGRPAAATPGADLSRITETPGPRDFDSEEEAIAYLGKILSRAPAHVIEESVRFGMRQTPSGRYTWKYDPAILKRAPATTDLWSMVKAIPTPTLLQYGSHSKVVSPELAQRLGLAKSTVHRLATTLIDAGMLEQNPETGKYRLGIALFRLGSLVRRRMTMSNEARPLLRDLLIMLLCLLGFAFSVSGVVIGWRRLKISAGGV